MALKKVVVTQRRSKIGRSEDQKRTLTALGLGRIGKKAEHQLTEPIVGMLAKVEHLISIENK